jgi:hypothetical protein
MGNLLKQATLREQVPRSHEPRVSGIFIGRERQSFVSAVNAWLGGCKPLVRFLRQCF